MMKYSLHFGMYVRSLHLGKGGHVLYSVDKAVMVFSPEFCGPKGTNNSIP